MSSQAYLEADLIPISALQHFIVCPRQCALIHLESVWIENERTAEGRVAHGRVDRGGAETRDAVRRAYGVPLRSLRLGLAGKADAVEFHAVPGGGPERPFPIEHKRGRPKRGDEDRVQLARKPCASKKCWACPCPRERCSTANRDGVPKWSSMTRFAARPRQWQQRCALCSMPALRPRPRRWRRANRARC
jgi:CRISPR/Cas system-associated exonuclease Cas4 (RecB family)